MKNSFEVASVDLGAESGRVILVTFKDTGINLEEVHRFPNGPVNILGNLHWNIAGLFQDIKYGLMNCKSRAENVNSIGLDTWGVDFGLLDIEGKLISLPYHYRDRRTDGMLEEVLEIVPMETIFQQTGIQFMQINSLYQLFAMRRSAQLGIANTFLMMPDLLNYWLCGEKVCEFTNATTTQMYDQNAKSWAWDILQDLGLPINIFPEVVVPGTEIGKLLPSIAEETGLGLIPIIAPACHDTGSAVAAVPVKDNQFAYISSGTWSLVGVEVPTPIINPLCQSYNFTNEGGVAGTVRLLKNVTGLWLVQECRRNWAHSGTSYSYAELANMAVSAPAFSSFVDPDSDEFLHPLEMPEAIRMHCSRSGQKIPDSRESILRCIFESLALKYRYVIECLEELTGSPINVIHIIGGGSQNELLNQFTADACGKLVVAGPVEATALGNAMVQAVSLGYFDSISQARVVISQTFPLKEYQPNKTQAWDDAFGKFKDLYLSPL